MNKIRIMEASVAKWDRIIAGRGRDGGVLDCPPCRIFYVLACTGCPIAAYSGHRFCKKTPYGPWFHHQTDAHGFMIRKVYCPECLRLAVAMRDYMQAIVDHLKKAGDQRPPVTRRAGPDRAQPQSASVKDMGRSDEAEL